MKKLIACLLVVVMLFTVAVAFAESSGAGRFVKSNAVRNCAEIFQSFSIRIVV